MKITLYGAAGEVTGSAYFVETASSKVLVDCGIFQGGRSADARNRKPLPIDLSKLDAIILTHGHLDHTGRLPLLVKGGYANPVYATPATMEITALVLQDSVRVQEHEIKRENRKRQRQGRILIQPNYSEKEVIRTIGLFKPMSYNTLMQITPDIQVRCTEAGHILGSVSIELVVSENNREKVVVFSGDVGPLGMAILKDPVPFRQADLVFLESTYGDRDHKSLRETLQEGQAVIDFAIANKGKILIPAFAIGQTQQLLYYLAASFHNALTPEFKVYIDSPMAIEATKIYLKHEELFDEETMELIKSGHLKADLSHVNYTPSPQESMALNNLDGPLMILAGSGMCNAGRILHHLRHNLWRPETSVIIVGYQGEGTLGRKLVDGATTVSIFGEKIMVRAQIHKLGGLSAHAGQSDLLRWIDAVAGSKPRIVLSHGEDKARKPLGEIIEKRYGITPIYPEYEQSIVI